MIAPADLVTEVKYTYTNVICCVTQLISLPATFLLLGPGVLLGVLVFLSQARFLLVLVVSVIHVLTITL